MTTPEEEANLAIATVLAGATGEYTAGEISAAEFVQELTAYMTPDVVFRSNYVPSWEPLRPLFAECRGIEEIVARYEYENEHEVIHEGSGMPFDFSIAGDVIYYSQHETASFFDRAPVTWDMITKLSFHETKIARIEMFLDAAPIEAVYGTTAEVGPLGDG